MSISPLVLYSLLPAPLFQGVATLSLSALFWTTVRAASPICPQLNRLLTWGKFAAELGGYLEGNLCLEITAESASRYLEALDQINPAALTDPPKGVRVLPAAQLRARIREIQEGKREEMRIAPWKEVPSFLFLHPHPEIHLMKDGKVAILGKTSLPEEKLDNARASLESVLARDIFAKAREEIKELSRQDSKGYRIDYSYAGHAVSWLLGMNPQNLTNYRRALQHLFRNLRDSDLFSMSNNQIISLLRSTHKRMFEGLLDHPGELRMKNGVIFENKEETRDRSIDGRREQLKKKGTAQDVRLFDQSVALMREKGWGLTELFEHLTEEQRAAWNKIAPIMPSYKLIPNKMNQFLDELKQNYHTGNMDFIALAAFAHRKIGEIHPFIDGNGRIARGLMNGILMLGGYQPVVFENDAEYVAAVNREIKEPGTFARFIIVR